MDIASLLLGLAVLLLVAFVVARPLLEQRGVREKEISRADQLLAERDGLLTTLRDLDFDHATGKIGDEDYAPQRAQLVAQGVAVLKQLDGLGRAGRESRQTDDTLEQAIAARRAKTAARAAPGPEDVIEAEIAARRKLSSEARRAPAANTVTCPNCGAPAQPGDLFCGKCGTKLQPVEAAG